MVDVDDLKITNDSQGHAVGDKLLQTTAAVLSTSFRAGDILARIGGDEFAALLPSTSAGTAEQVVARIRENVAEQNKTDAGLPVKVSIGVSTAEAGELAVAFMQADQAMYADKESRSGNGSKERAALR
jgi:diguanylate cyclase (GGDEF)-like protein